MSELSSKTASVKPSREAVTCLYSFPRSCNLSLLKQINVPVILHQKCTDFLNGGVFYE